MHRWNLSALAAAAFFAAGLYAADASALALGRLNVQSALGEPLRAEIELPQISAAEAESLRVAPASPEVFRAQGAEYSSAASSVQMQLQRRADGSMVLRLSSSRPINDPFVDLVVDANWTSGHIVRSYTLLLDPPSLRKPPAAVTAAAQVQPPAPRAGAPAVRAEPAPARPRAAPAAAAAAARPAEPAAASDEVAVRPGDTAGRIAAAHRPDGVSLDQMLVAMMRANPDAFIQGNVNRLRAGSVLQMPDAGAAQATAPAEARRIVAAQSRDFNEFRRRLADAAPSAQQAAAERSASGTVQTQVQDGTAAAPGPDKLTLSKGGVSASQAEAQLARGKQAGEDAARMAELSRNISELNRIGGASVAAGAATPATAPASAPTDAAAAGLAVPATGAAAPSAAPAAAPSAAPAAPASADAPAAGPAEPAASVDASAAAAQPQSATASGPQAGTAAADAAPASAAVAPPPTPAAVPPAPMDVEEPSFIGSLLEDPLLAGGALAILLALLGYGGWRVIQNRRAQGAVDSSFMDSRKGPDSFFGASGGQRVDTANSELTTGSSSMSYSPSQLDAGDVDPVAEADVYLAYGRDLQAEEILKEAQRHHPDRVSIPAKLAEIHAKRQDRRALEVAAGEVLRLTGGRGTEWARVSELGRSIDPDNPLYRTGAAVAAADTSAIAGAAGAAGAAAAMAASAPSAPDSELPDLDLDLDFDLDLHEAPPAAPPPSSFAAAAAAAEDARANADAAPSAATGLPAAADPGMDFALGDLDLPDGSWEASRPVTPPPVEHQAAGLATPPSPLDLEDAGLELPVSAPAPLAPEDNPESERAALEFDLGDLSLDLGAPSQPAALTESATLNASLLDTAPGELPLPEDSLATKLALAEEFNAIGDSEGARALVEEVIADSSGELRARAQRLLATLS